MSSTQEKFGFHTFRKEITATLGDAFFEKLTLGMELPDMESEADCGCERMAEFMERLDEAVEPDVRADMLYRVRHGLKPEMVSWAHEEFVEMGEDLDAFIQKHLDSEWENFVQLYETGEEWFGNVITDEVLEFIRQHPHMLAPVRQGNKLICMAFPGQLHAYVTETDPQMKRYYACHCPFARESILTGRPVSSSLCNCSMGHVANFSEGFLGCSLHGRVTKSVLAGDLTCEYEYDLSDEIMEKYVHTKEERR